MNIILFGPPGIGKSTLIGDLKTSGQRAIDLEDIYPSRIRFQIPNQVDGCFLGAADLDPKRPIPNSFKVLLHMPQSKYELRRKQRDAVVPGKSKQTDQRVDDWVAGAKYDCVLDVGRSRKAVLQDLLKIASRVLKSTKMKGR